MRRIWIILPLALTLAGLVVGCGSNGSDTASATKEETPAAKPAAGGTEAQFASVDGQLGCGHCNFQVGNGCSLAMKTASGVIYKIEAGERQDELFSIRMDQPQVKIKGKVSEVDGQKIIYAENIEME